MPFYINVLLNVFNFFNHQTLKADAPDLFQKAVLLSETLNLRRLLRGKSVRSSWPKERADHQRIMCFKSVSLFFSSLTLCLNLCQRGSPSDINSVPTCPNQNWSTTNEQKFDNRTTLTTRINVHFFLFSHLLHRYVCLFPTLHGDSAKRRNTCHGLQRWERFGVRRSLKKISPSLMVVMLFLNLRSYYESWTSND